MSRYGYRRGFDFGNFEITKREIIASISIIAVMLLIGVMLSGKISEWQMDKNEIYNKAIHVDSTELFQHGMNTNIGNAFVYGDLRAVDTVTYPEIGGKYIFVEKVEKRYERHEKWEKEEDENGDMQQKLKVWYDWEIEASESKHAEKIKFCDVIFPYSKINVPGSTCIDTISGGRAYSCKSGEYVKVKYEYYGTGTEFTGTIFTDLRDKTISDNTPFYNDMSIEKTIEHLESGGGLILFFFWIGWIIVTGLLVYGFFYLDNRWLE